MRARRAAAAALATLALAGSAASAAAAAPRVSLHARFTPDRLGASTTIHYSFTVSEPAPLATMALRLPPGMGFAHTSLGLEECAPALLEAQGPRACPADSRLGAGTALAAVPARTTVEERAKVTAVMGPMDGRQMTLLFYVDGRWPVRRQIILTSHVQEVGGRDGATLATAIPPLTVWPEGPDIGLMRLSSTIGPQGLTYYRPIGHRRVAFKPRGVALPDRCPRGGFRVSATFTWWGIEGTQTARTRVPCPQDPRGSHRRGGRGSHRRGHAAARRSHRGRGVRGHAT